MGWLSWLGGWTTRDQIERASETFVPREWDEHFAGLAPAERRAAAAELCRTVVAGAGLHGDAVERAIAALAYDRVTEDLLRSVRSLAERCEGEYDSLVDDDESKLSCTDPKIEAAFRRLVAASALRGALEGDLSGMAYEAWFVLDDLAEVRRLAGMPHANHRSG